MSPSQSKSYDDLLAEGRRIHGAVSIGRPGRSRMYWLTIGAMRLLRVKLRVRVEGAEHVRGGALLIGNHMSWWDPVSVVMSQRWRVTAFTKVEAFEGRGAYFFRCMGQIPLRRGDEEATEWALAMSGATLADGGKLGLYPEGTRTPDPTKLHRLHTRVLMPVLVANPDVPVHAVALRYEKPSRGRTRAFVRFSPALPVDTRTMSGDEITVVIRDALLTLGGQTYVDEFAQTAKRRAAREAAEASGST